MKSIFILVVLMGLSSSVLNAQQWANGFLTEKFYGNKKLTLEMIQGTPYLEKSFVKGTVITDDGQIFKDIPLRYNCYNDNIEFDKEGTSYDLVPKEKVKRAEFGGQIFTYAEYEPGGSNRAFFKILAEGKAMLYARYKIKFYEQEPLKGYADPKPARFDELTEDFYVSINENPAQRITNSKKILEIFADKQDEMNSYISKQKLSVKKSGDLKKIVSYYNSL